MTFMLCKITYRLYQIRSVSEAVAEANQAGDARVKDGVSQADTVRVSFGWQPIA